MIVRFVEEGDFRATIFKLGDNLATTEKRRLPNGGKIAAPKISQGSNEIINVPLLFLGGRAFWSDLWAFFCVVVVKSQSRRKRTMGGGFPSFFKVEPSVEINL